MRFHVEPGSLDAVLIQLTSVGVNSLTSHPPTLEELFLRHYGIGEAGSVDAEDAGL